MFAFVVPKKAGQKTKKKKRKMAFECLISQITAQRAAAVSAGTRK
jgi:hypothetical protein